MDSYHIDFFWTSLISSSCQSCHPISSLPRIEMLQSISFARPSSCQLSSTTRQRQVLRTKLLQKQLIYTKRIGLVFMNRHMIEAVSLKGDATETDTVLLATV